MGNFLRHLILFLPVLAIGQSIQFDHSYNHFAVLEGQNDTFNLRLSSLPSGDVTVVITDPSGLFSFSSDTLTFTTGNYNTYQPITITTPTTPAITNNEDVMLTFSGSGGGYDGVTLNQTVTKRERNGDLVVWLIPDPHTEGNDIDAGIYPLRDALEDAANGGDESGEPFSWDIALFMGDYTGDNTPYDSTIGATYAFEFQSTSTDVNLVYPVYGNHDSGDSLSIGLSADHIFYRKYIDPFGEFTATSGVHDTLRPYPTIQRSTSRNSYWFEVGNLMFLGHNDRNDVSAPMGKNQLHTGSPAGTYTKESTEILDSLIRYNPQATIINWSHHMPHNTTAYTGFYEGTEIPRQHGPTSGPVNNWMDSIGAAIIYTYYDENGGTFATIDGYDENQSFVGIPSYGFQKTLNSRQDRHVWVGGHTHSFVTPIDTLNGRPMVLKNSGANSVTYIQTTGITRRWTNNTNFTDPATTRVLHFYEGEKTVRLQTYEHRTVTTASSLKVVGNRNKVFIEGFLDSYEILFEIETCFDSDYDLSQQNIRGNCAQCNN